MGSCLIGCIIFFGFYIQFVHDSKVECFSVETEVYNCSNH